MTHRFGGRHGGCSWGSRWFGDGGFGGRSLEGDVGERHAGGPGEQRPGPVQLGPSGRVGGHVFAHRLGVRLVEQVVQVVQEKFVEPVVGQHGRLLPRVRAV